MFRAVKSIRFSLKAGIVKPVERNSKTIRNRKCYVWNFMRLEAANTNFVFLDEFGCNISLRRRKGYIIVGTPCHVSASVIHRVSEWTNRNSDIALSVDNAALHKTNLVRDFLRKNFIKYLYLPPYSSTLNLFEECFSKVQISIRKFLLNGRDNLSAVDEAFKNVTSSNCQSWFGHCKKFFPLCISEQPINNTPEEFLLSDEDVSIGSYLKRDGGAPLAIGLPINKAR